MATKNPPPTKIIGDQSAQRISSVPSIAGTEAYDVWRGPTESLTAWSNEVLAKYAGKRIRVSLSQSGSLTEMTVTDTGSGADSGEGAQSTGDDARTPTLTLSMGTFARPIETIKTPTDFTTISVDRVAAIRKMVRTADTASLKKLSGVEATYAQLLATGITTRADPCYQAQATRYIRLDKNFKASVGSPWESLSWGAVVQWLGNAKASYSEPRTGLTWRATGMTITIREGQWAEVSKTFDGAEWWPEALYGK